MSTSGNVLHQMMQSPFACLDPGASGTIRPDRHMGVTPVITATAEARTLAQPTKAGLIHTVVLDTDGGDLTLTVTGGYNADGATSITFADAGDFVAFLSVKVGTSYYWRVLAQEGTNVAVEDIAVDQLAVTTLTIGSTAVTATAAQLNSMAGALTGATALVASGIGGSKSVVNTDAETATVLAAHATKDRACIAIVTIDETYAAGGGTAPTLKVGEDDTIEKAFAAATIAGKSAGTTLVVAFTNLATKKVITTTTAKVGGGTGGATVTVIAIPTT